LITIRAETASDYDAVYRVEEAAFEEDFEARLVNALRGSKSEILSLIAEDEGEVVGHILFTHMTIESDKGIFGAVHLGPLAVSPSHQRRGIGGQLIAAGLEELRSEGHGAVLLFGHTSYYPRHGFRPAREFDVHCEDDRDSFMAIELYPGALDNVSGQYRLSPELEEVRSEENKATVLGIYEAINSGDFQALDSLIADTFIEHENGVEPPTKAGAIEALQRMREAFGDFTIIVEDMIAEGDRVFVRATMSGLHQVEFMGTPPTGRQVRAPVADFFRIAGWRAIEHWGLIDTGMLMQQLDVDELPVE
jgi:putative acetyltransferase